MKTNVEVFNACKLSDFELDLETVNFLYERFAEFDMVQVLDREDIVEVLEDLEEWGEDVEPNIKEELKKVGKALLDKKIKTIIFDA